MLNAFVDTVTIESADLKNNWIFILEFPYFLDVGRGRWMQYVA